MTSMDDFFKTKKTTMSPREASKSDKSIPKGPVEKKVYGNYYDVDNTITTAQLTNPNDPDASILVAGVITPVYNQEKVFEALERNAEQIEVSNDNPLGGAILYVIASHMGGQDFSRERPIYPQQVKTFYNIYELRLRSPLAGSPYRVTEYNIESFT